MVLSVSIVFTNEISSSSFVAILSCSCIGGTGTSKFDIFDLLIIDIVVADDSTNN